MPSKVRIGYLIPQFPGQTHTFFWREISVLETLGAEVTIFSTRLPPKRLISHAWSFEAIDRTIYLGRPSIGAILTLCRIAPELIGFAKQGPAFLRDVMACLSAAERLVAECEARGIRHVHVHSCGRSALVAALANRLTGLSYSLTLHGPLEDYGPGQGIKWRNAAFAIIITQALLRETRALLGGDMPERVVVQPMGVSTDRFLRHEPFQPPRPGAPIRVFSCARLNPVKGHLDAFESIAMLTRSGLDVELEIAGEDDDGGTGYRTVLEARLRELKLGHRVRLLGAISEDAVLHKLRQAHLFVLASLHEPLGVAYMEAMSCGVPTIGTRAGGVPELITHGETGILIEPGRPDELATAIEKLASDPQGCERMGQVARRRIVEQFDSARGAEALLDLIEESTRRDGCWASRRRDGTRPVHQPA